MADRAALQPARRSGDRLAAPARSPGRPTAAQARRAPAAPGRLRPSQVPASEGPGEAPPVVHQVLRNPGAPLDPGARSLMEDRLGVDFSHVRVHTDGAAHAPAAPGRLRPSQVPASEGPGEAPPVVHQVLRNPGAPLDPGARSLMEDRLGVDFSHVRVHTDTRAAASAQAVGAFAYTHGSSIVFDSGRYPPHDEEGRNLLAHELVHTVQQGRTEPPSSNQRLTVESPDSPTEHETRAIAQASETRALHSGRYAGPTEQVLPRVTEGLRRIGNRAVTKLAGRRPVLQRTGPAEKLKTYVEGDGAHLHRHLTDWAQYGVTSVEEVREIAESLFYQAKPEDWKNKAGTYAVDMMHGEVPVRLVWGLGGIVSCFPITERPRAAVAGPRRQGYQSAQTTAVAGPQLPGYQSAQTTAVAGPQLPGYQPAQTTAVAGAQVVLALPNEHTVEYNGYQWGRFGGQLFWWDQNNSVWRERYEGNQDWLF